LFGICCGLLFIPIAWRHQTGSSYTSDAFVVIPVFPGIIDIVWSGLIAILWKLAE